MSVSSACEASRPVHCLFKLDLCSLLMQPSLATCPHIAHAIHAVRKYVPFATSPLVMQMLGSCEIYTALHMKWHTCWSTAMWEAPRRPARHQVLMCKAEGHAQRQPCQPHQCQFRCCVTQAILLGSLFACSTCLLLPQKKSKSTCVMLKLAGGESYLTRVRCFALLLLEMLAPAQ